MNKAASFTVTNGKIAGNYAKEQMTQENLNKATSFAVTNGKIAGNYAKEHMT